MKKATIVCLLCFFPVFCIAQYVDYAKINQMLLMEGIPGGDMLDPSLVWHYQSRFLGDYIRSGEISLRNKMQYRISAMGLATSQVDYAEQMDSVYKKRAEVEAVNLVDRDPGCSINPVGDVAWDIEGDKIKEAQVRYKRNLSILSDFDGISPEIVRDWEGQYNMISTAIKEMQQAYMPNSKRQKQYLAIYQDLVARNEKLATLVQSYTYQSLMGDASSVEAHPFQLADRASIASQALSRWNLNYKNK